MSEESVLKVSAVSASSEQLMLAKIVEDFQDRELDKMRSINRDQELYSGTGVIEKSSSRSILTQSVLL